MVLLNIPLRFKNKAFWVAFIPAVLMLVQAVVAIFGITLDLNEVSGRILAAVDALFVVLAILGIAVDPTTDGVSDSERALDYDTPAPNATETFKENEIVDQLENMVSEEATDTELPSQSTKPDIEER